MLSTPDITTAQIVALVQAVIGLVVAFGFGVSDDLQDAIVQLCTAVVVFLPLADSVVRNGRARGTMRKQ